MTDPLPSETIAARLGIAYRRHMRGVLPMPDFLREALTIGESAARWLDAQMDDEENEAT